jgi:uncharacterized protein YcbK (DUF882 family)
MSDWRHQRVGRFFTLGEFACDHKARPPSRTDVWIAHLCDVYLDPLRVRFGPVTIISGCRSPAHNSEIGGARDSQHLYSVPSHRGVAADVICERGTPREWYRFLDARNPGGLGLYTTHVHVDNRPGRARW